MPAPVICVLIVAAHRKAINTGHDNKLLNVSRVFDRQRRSAIEKHIPCQLKFIFEAGRLLSPCVVKRILHKSWNERPASCEVSRVEPTKKLTRCIIYSIRIRLLVPLVYCYRYWFGYGWNVKLNPLFASLSTESGDCHLSTSNSTSNSNTTTIVVYP